MEMTSKRSGASLSPRVEAKRRAARTIRRRLPKVTLSWPAPWALPRRCFTSTNTVTTPSRAITSTSPERQRKLRATIA
jgi:hypothetical protein